MDDFTTLHAITNTRLGIAEEKALIIANKTKIVFGTEIIKLLTWLVFVIRSRISVIESARRLQVRFGVIYAVVNQINVRLPELSPRDAGHEFSELGV